MWFAARYWNATWFEDGMKYQIFDVSEGENEVEESWSSSKSNGKYVNAPLI